MMIDYLIVGAGLGGISFAEVALQNHKDIVVFENHSQTSSKVAGGMYNPVIIKRFLKVWKAQEELDFLPQFYGKIEQRINCTVNFKLPFYRKIFSAEEQNEWIHASDRKELERFLSSSIHHKKYNHIASPFGYGEVLQTGYVDTKLLLQKYQAYLSDNKLIRFESFDYDEIKIFSDHIQYKYVKAKHIIFADGYGLVNNPYFDKLPLDGAKGELLIVKIKEINLDAVVKSSVFLMPLGNDLYKVGATYDWDDKSNEPTAAGKEELVSKLKEVLECEFEVVDHLAGIRPTTKDRRPMIGTHPNFPLLHVLNGLGTRGVMIGPDMATQLFNFIEHNSEIDAEANIKRFRKIVW